MDLVTIIIPTYNRFKYLLNAIKSAKEQTYQNIEIIIVMIVLLKKNIIILISKKNLGRMF